MYSSSQTPTISTKSADEFLTVNCPKCKGKLSHFYINEKELIFMCTSSNVSLFSLPHLSCTNSQVISTNQGILTECHFPFEEDDINFYICLDDQIKEKYFELHNKFVEKDTKFEGFEDQFLLDFIKDETQEIFEGEQIF